MLSEFLKLLSKIHSVTHSVTQVTFYVLQFFVFVFLRYKLKVFPLQPEENSW